MPEFTFKIQRFNPDLEYRDGIIDLVRPPLSK